MGGVAVSVSAWRLWSALPQASREVMPDVHPGRRMHAQPEAVVGLAGYYRADGACPIGEGTQGIFYERADVLTWDRA